MNLSSRSSRIWILVNACTLVLTLGSASLGQDGTRALTEKVEAFNSTLVQKISQAINGDTVVQQELLRGYLAPSVMTLAILFICYMVASSVARVAGGLVSSKIDLTLGRFLTKAIRVLLMLLVAMALLEYNNISVSGFAAVLAAMSFAVGLSLQGTLSNFAAGIMLLIFRPFKVDDSIAVAGVEGKVEEVDLFTTRINTGDNRHIIIPNSEIFGNKLENFDRNPLRRVDVSVGTSYAADLKLTRRALEYAIQVSAESCSIEDSQVVLMELGTHAIQWQVRAWTPRDCVSQTREVITESTKYALDAHNISIPFPQLDLHLGGKLMAKAG
jgi:small conductance mechanosensitive channel